LYIGDRSSDESTRSDSHKRSRSGSSGKSYTTSKHSSGRSQTARGSAELRKRPRRVWNSRPARDAAQRSSLYDEVFSDASSEMMMAPSPSPTSSSSQGCREASNVSPEKVSKRSSSHLDGAASVGTSSASSDKPKQPKARNALFSYTPVRY
jgi:hypothetical protein